VKAHLGMKKPPDSVEPEGFRYGGGTAMCLTSLLVGWLVGILSIGSPTLPVAIPVLGSVAVSLMYSHSISGV
jgi:hypothetical protein